MCMCVSGPGGGQSSVSDPLELELQRAVVLGAESGFFAGIPCTCNC